MAFTFAFDEDKYNLHRRPFSVPENKPRKQTSQDTVACGFENLKLTVLDKLPTRVSSISKRGYMVKRQKNNN